MKIIKVGKHTFMRHWFRWYFVHQAYGGDVFEKNWLTRVEFTEPKVIID